MSKKYYYELNNGDETLYCSVELPIKEEALPELICMPTNNPFRSPIFKLNNEKIKQCKSCMHSDSTRTNDIDEIRCKKFHTYVSPFSYCDYFDTEANAKLKEMLSGVMQNE